MTITLENLYTHSTGLSSSAFRRIQGALRAAEQLEKMSLKEVGEWWGELQEDFRRLRQNHQDYLREFYGPSAEKQMKSAEFLVYKQHLIRYLEDFVQDLQSSAAQIGALLESFSEEQVHRILTLVHKSALEVPRPHGDQGSFWQQELWQQEQGVWNSLMEWFTGKDSTARQVMDVTNEVIRRVVQNAAILVQMQNMGVSNKAELRHLMTLFAGVPSMEDAHRLSALVFGSQQCRHFIRNAERETERIDLSTYEEPPLDYALQPRLQNPGGRAPPSGKDPALCSRGEAGFLCLKGAGPAGGAQRIPVVGSYGKPRARWLRDYPVWAAFFPGKARGGNVPVGVHRRHAFHAGLRAGV